MSLLFNQLGRGLLCLIAPLSAMRRTGTGQDFGNFVDTAQAIREVLLADGWVENEAHHADGPTGTASGYAKENQLAFVQVDWQPSAAVQSPADQPISACNVEPGQQIFTVKIALMQTG